jgi:uncharacterized protein (TIGR02611 family)
MLEKAKGGWQSFKESEPGHRFQDRYRRRQRQSSGWLDPGTVLNVLAGVVIMAAGLFLVPFPGPGWLVTFLGLGFIAGEFRPVARLLDWIEVRARRLLRWARSIWDRSPAPVKALIVLVAVAVGAALAFGAYRLLFS